MTMTQDDLIQALRDQLSNSIVLIDNADLEAAFGELSDRKRAADEAGGRSRSYRKEAVKKLRVHKDAFAWWEKLRDKSAAERADYLRSAMSLLFYGLDGLGWLEQLTDLASKAETGGEEAPARGDDWNLNDLDPDAVGDEMDKIEGETEEVSGEGIPGHPDDAA